MRKSALNVRPFEPVEVKLSSGQVFAIKHPENVIVSNSTFVVADPETESVQWTYRFMSWQYVADRHLLLSA